mmetsp:Transcript_120119/g.347049  ORF Transcript_120119/g.347049 Transcript_120119/m.347049 type:complete len:203 (+) Transcript_120119:695-1303(+)
MDAAPAARLLEGNAAFRAGGRLREDHKPSDGGDVQRQLEAGGNRLPLVVSELLCVDGPDDSMDPSGRAPGCPEAAGLGRGGVAEDRAELRVRRREGSPHEFRRLLGRRVHRRCRRTPWQHRRLAQTPPHRVPLLQLPPRQRRRFGIRWVGPEAGGRQHHPRQRLRQDKRRQHREQQRGALHGPRRGTRRGKQRRQRRWRRGP